MVRAFNAGSLMVLSLYMLSMKQVHADGIVLSTESLRGTSGERHFDHTKYMENQIITSLNNCPLCREKEPCLMDCRTQEHKSWNECLNRCLGDNPMLLSVFQGIVSSETHQLHGFGK
eukprot:CAMPEP_0172714690 /NCGR_PEP_ID=MMETSP1074-20121228/66527_1 /TAXON_ID=2916 /ORGANISM="Ceratium fusus, Strain PA161109" /LENGTH=116 /DNA_ID=CAMNT_0013539161 /DNA_START=64 /DNA_END=414 /DNA_ORIENTATION=+